MTLLGRFAPWCGISVALLLGSVNACSTDDSGGFSNGGTSSKGGSTSTAGNGNGATSTTAGSSGIETASDAGVIIPDSSVEDTDTYTTSCPTEGCPEGYACYESCPDGSCCVHACPGQTGTTGSDVTCCDQQGGVIPGASCAS